MTGAPAPEDVVLHRGDMLLLDRIVSCDDEACIAEYTPRADAWYADGHGDMPAWIGIELMAQAVAAQVGEEKRLGGLPPRLGMLIGARSYKAATPAFAATECLQISARLTFRDESGLAAYDCEIRQTVDPRRVLASATLKVFEPDDFSAFLKGAVE